uniref:Uncharacterized protein n=1 Tax=Anopheles darlingi TaxID=43151 RepID=A0A2M4D253_ANODA
MLPENNYGKILLELLVLTKEALSLILFLFLSLSPSLSLYLPFRLFCVYLRTQRDEKWRQNQDERDKEGRKIMSEVLVRVDKGL